MTKKKKEYMFRTCKDKNCRYQDWNYDIHGDWCPACRKKHKHWEYELRPVKDWY